MLKNKPLSKSSFTLIELLVIVAIIGILITLLLPSLRKARELTKQAVCMSNLQQVGIANALYLKDNNYNFISAQHIYNDNNYYRRRGRSLPPVVTSGSSYKSIYDFNYIKNFDLWLCPSQERVGWHSSLYWAASYPINQYLIDRSLHYAASKASSSEIIFTMDAHTLANIAYNTHVITPRHNKKANALFLDGHVDALHYQYIFKNPQMIGYDKNVTGHPWNRSRNWGIDNFSFNK
jgi:prepilin-type processing-associated H-X9-DG protein